AGHRHRTVEGAARRRQTRPSARGLEGDDQTERRVGVARRTQTCEAVSTPIARRAARAQTQEPIGRLARRARAAGPVGGPPALRPRSQRDPEEGRAHASAAPPRVLIIRGASPLGLPFTLCRAPLRRRAPFAWRARRARPRPLFALRC